MEHTDAQAERYFSDPTDPLSFSAPSDAPYHPDHGAPGFDPEPGSLPGSSPSLVHTQQTSVGQSDSGSYRAFLISGCTKQVRIARHLYKALSDLRNRDYLARFDSCRTDAWFVRHRQTGKIRIESNRCGLRWCPLCQRVRRNLMQVGIVDWLQEVQRPKFLTLTLRSSDEDLSIQIDRLYRCFRKFRLWKAIKAKLRGGVWFFQITYNQERKQWHPHIHILIDSEYLCQQYLSDVWLTITGNSDIVDIRAVQDAKDAAQYVARYATSPADTRKIDACNLVELALSMEYRRICGTFGNAKGVPLSPQKSPDWCQWERLFSFRTIYTGRVREAVAQEVWDCWKSGEKCYILPIDYHPPPTPCDRLTDETPDCFPEQSLLF